MNTLIIQYSPEHTASTLLVNALYGLIPSLKSKPINYNDFRLNPNAEIQVIKTHNSNLDWFICRYSRLYNLFFICSEREERNLLVNSKYKLYDRVIVFPFSELNETESNPLSTIINNIANKISHKFGSLLNIVLDVDSGIRRVTLMNELYETIKHKPFTYYDRVYHIHGSHRNRPATTSNTPVTPVAPKNTIERKKRTVQMQYLYA